MLQKIHDGAKGWIAYAIVILISIPFALWGLDQYFGGAPERVVAEVNGVEIAQRTFQQEYQNQRQQLAAMFGGRIPSGVVDDATLRENALQMLIRRELMTQMAEKKGFRISAATVAAEIRAIPGFQQDGVFDAERYRRVLESQRRSPAQFESLVSEAILLDQFQRGYLQGAFLPDAMLNDYLKLRHERRQISLHTVPASAYVDDIEIDDEQVARYHEQHADRFRSPERVRLAYLLLDDTSLVEQINPLEEDLRREYEQRLEQYTRPEERRASHILIRVPEDADAETVARAEARAQEVRQRLADGEDFAQLASEVSDDPLAERGGGDLGFIVRGDMDPNLEAVLFTLRKDGVSQPIRTALGYQVVKLTDIRPAERAPFEEVRDQVETEYRNRRAESLQIELTERLLTESYEQPGTLEPAAEATGLEIRHTDWLTRDGRGEGIAAEPEVLRLAFSEEILSGRNSDLIDLSDGSVAVIRVHQHEPAAPRPLEDVAEEIRLHLLRDEARRRAEEAGQKALERLREGMDFIEAVADLPGVGEEDRWVTRDEGTIPARVVQHVFNMPRPSGDAPLRAGMGLDNGDYVVLVQHQWEPGEVNDTARTRVAGQLSGFYGGAEFEALYQALEAGAKIRIYRENL